MEKKKIESLFDRMNDKPIAFHRVYARITGKITAGLLLSQLVYWDKAMDGTEFYKTDDDFCNELSMGKWELKTAKKILKDLKIVEISRKGVPATTFYKLDKNRLIELITSCEVYQQPVVGKTNNKSEVLPTTIYTENTTENTTDIITKKTEKFIKKLKEELKDEKLKRDEVEDIKSFTSYWTEPNKSGTKIRWEIQPTWDMRRRLLTWMRNKDKWGINKKKGGVTLEV